jgi:hypothetical protein
MASPGRYKQPKLTEMGTDVQEVVARWLFQEEHVHTTTNQDLFCMSKGSVGVWVFEEARVELLNTKNWLDSSFTTTCSVPSALRIFGRVGPAWQAAYKSWLARESARVTETFWECAVLASVALCRRGGYLHPMPWMTALRHKLVFEGDAMAFPEQSTEPTMVYYVLRPVVSVVFVRHGNGDQHALTARVTKGVESGAWRGAVVAPEGWQAWSGPEGLQLKRAFAAWEAACTADLGEWVRGQ